LIRDTCKKWRAKFSVHIARRFEPPPLRPMQAAFRYSSLRMSTANSHHVPVIGFFAALAILGGMSAMSYFSLQGFAERARSVEHTQRVLRETEAVLSDLKDVETGVRGYLISGQTTFLVPYTEALTSIPNHLRLLNELTVDNDEQQKRIRDLEKLVDRRLQQAAHFFELAGSAHLLVSEQVRKHIVAGKSTMDEIRRVAGDMRAREEILLVQRAEDSKRSSSTAGAIIVAGTIASITMLVVAFILLGREIKQRASAERAAQASTAETESLYNEAPCGYHSVDKDGIFVRMNNTELAWLGYSRDEVIGKLKFIDIVAPGFRQTVIDNFPRLVLAKRPRIWNTRWSARTAARSQL